MLYVIRRYYSRVLDLQLRTLLKLYLPITNCKWALDIIVSVTFVFTTYSIHSALSTQLNAHSMSKFSFPLPFALIVDDLNSLTSLLVNARAVLFITLFRAIRCTDSLSVLMKLLAYPQRGGYSAVSFSSHLVNFSFSTSVMLKRFALKFTC